VGLSACLRGEPVRWDGDHRRHDFLVASLGPHLEWVALCPEAEIGLGVPREPIQLVRTESGPRLYSVRSHHDLTERMRDWATARLAGLGDLDGFVLKHRSPSCGITGARVSPSLEELREDGPCERGGRGVFAEVLLRERPEIAVAEEPDLESRDGRQRFVERVFAARRLRARLARGAEPADLVRFVDGHAARVLARAGGPEALAELAGLARRGDGSRLRIAFAAALARPPAAGAGDPTADPRDPAERAALAVC